MKNYGDLGGCYPPRPTASTDNQFLDLHNSLQDAQPHSLIVDEALPFAKKVVSAHLKSS